MVIGESLNGFLIHKDSCLGYTSFSWNCLDYIYDSSIIGQYSSHHLYSHLLNTPLRCLSSQLFCFPLSLCALIAIESKRLKPFPNDINICMPVNSIQGCFSYDLLHTFCPSVTLWRIIGMFLNMTFNNAAVLHSFWKLIKQLLCRCKSPKMICYGANNYYFLSKYTRLKSGATAAIQVYIDSGNPFWL